MSTGKYDGLKLQDVVREFARLKADIEAREQAVKELKKEYDFLRFVKIPEMFLDTDTTNLTMDGIGRVSLTDDMHVGIQSGKKEEAHQFLRDIGADSLISETVNASTLKAFVKEKFRSGEPLPEELFRISPFTRASLTKV